LASQSGYRKQIGLSLVIESVIIWPQSGYRKCDFLASQSSYRKFVLGLSLVIESVIIWPHSLVIESVIIWSHSLVIESFFWASV